MKTAILFYLFTVLPSSSFSQDIDSVVLGTNHYKLRLGDTIVIGLPSGKANQFLFISGDTTKTPEKTHVFAEPDDFSRTIRASSIEEMMKNSNLQYRDKNVDASQLGSIWIRDESPLTSTGLRIVRFDHYLDDKGRQYSFAIGITEAGEKFRVNLEDAIYTGELSSHNSKMFENFVIKTGIFVEAE